MLPYPGGQRGDAGDLGRVEVLPEDPLRPAGAAASDDLLAGDDQVEAEVVAGFGQRPLSAPGKRPPACAPGGPRRARGSPAWPGPPPPGRERTLRSPLLPSRGADQAIHELLGQGVAGGLGDPYHPDAGAAPEGIGELVTGLVNAGHHGHVAIE
jgi:hypothetical protein